MYTLFRPPPSSTALEETHFSNLAYTTWSQVALTMAVVVKKACVDEFYPIFTIVGYSGVFLCMLVHWGGARIVQTNG